MQSELSSESDLSGKKSLSERLKRFLFTTLNRVLETKRISVRGGYFLIFLQFTGLVSLIMSKKNPILVTILGDYSKYLSYIRVYPLLLEDENNPLYFLLVGLITLVLGCVLFVSFKIYSFDEYEHRKHQKMKELYALALDTIDTALVMPFSGVIGSGFNCSTQGDSGVPQCFQFMHIFRSVISFILGLTLGTTIFIIALFFFNFGISSKDSLNRSPHVFHFIVRIYTVAVVFIDLLLTSDEFLVITAIHTVGTIAFCLDYYMRLPYYNQNISQFYCFAVFTYFWISIGFFTSDVVDSPLITDNILYIILVGFLFFIYIVRTFRNRFFSELLLKETSEIQNEIHLDARFRYLIRLYKQSKTNKESEMLLLAVIKRHSDTCRDEECVCNKRKRLYDPKIAQFSDLEKPLYRDDVFVKNYFLQIIQESLRLFSQSIVLNLDYFLYLMNELRNLPLLNNQINAFMKNKESSTQTTMQYCIYRIRLQQKIHLKSLNNEKKLSKMRYERVRNFDEGLGFLENRIGDIVDVCQIMWDSLTNHIPDLDLLKTYCTKIVDKKKTIYTLYKEALSHNNHSYELFLLMRLYSEFVIFDDLLSMEVQDSIELIDDFKLENSIEINMDEFLNKMDMFGNNTCVIFMSMAHENLGNITWASTNCFSIFGYDTKELKRMNVDSLMPAEVALHHQTFLKWFYEIGYQANMNKLSHLWGLEKSKLLFSMKLLLKMFMLGEEIFVVGLINRLNDSDYVLTNRLGILEGFGSLFESFLGVSHAEWSQQQYKLNLLLLAPKLMKYFRYSFFAIKNKKVYNKEDEEREAIEELKAGRNKRFFKLFVPLNINTFLREFTDEYNSILNNFETAEGSNGLQLRIEISQMLYRWTIRVENMQYAKILKIKAHISLREFGKKKLQLFQLKILSHATFQKEKFTKEKRKAEFAERETMKASNSALGTLDRMVKKKESELTAKPRNSLLLRFGKREKEKSGSGLFNVFRTKMARESGLIENKSEIFQENGESEGAKRAAKPGEGLKGLLLKRNKNPVMTESTVGSKVIKRTGLKEMLLKKGNNAPGILKTKETGGRPSLLKGLLGIKNEGKPKEQKGNSNESNPTNGTGSGENNQKSKTEAEPAKEGIMGGLLSKLKGRGADGAGTTAPVTTPSPSPGPKPSLLGGGLGLKNKLLGSASKASSPEAPSSSQAPLVNSETKESPKEVAKPAPKTLKGGLGLLGRRSLNPEPSLRPALGPEQSPPLPSIDVKKPPEEEKSKKAPKISGFMSKLVRNNSKEQEFDRNNQLSPSHLTPPVQGSSGPDSGFFKFSHNLKTPESTRRKNLLQIDFNDPKKATNFFGILRKASNSSSGTRKRQTYDFSSFDLAFEENDKEDEIKKSEDEESKDEEEASLLEEENSDSMGVESTQQVKGKNKFQNTVNRFLSIKMFASLYISNKKEEEPKELKKKAGSNKAPTIKTNKEKNKFLDKGIAASVASSVSSVVSYKADLKKIRDLLQNQSTPLILQFAIGIIITFSVLTLFCAVLFFFLCNGLINNLEKYLESLPNIAQVSNSLANINLLISWGSIKISMDGPNIQKNQMDFQELTADITNIDYDASLEELVEWSENQMNEVLMEADFTIIRNFFYNKEAFWTLDVNNEFVLQEMLLITYIRNFISYAKNFNQEDLDYFYLNLTPFVNYLLGFFEDVSSIVLDWIQFFWVYIILDMSLKPFLFCLGLIITFPVVVQIMLKVEDVLELFTKIGQKEVNVYAMHFKSLSTELKNFESFESLYDQARNRYIDQLKNKSQLKVIGTSSTLIRRLKVNKWSILWKYVLLGLGVSIVLILNDILLIYLCRIYEGTGYLYEDSVLSETNLKNAYSQLLQAYNQGFFGENDASAIESLIETYELLEETSIELFQDIYREKYSESLSAFLDSMNTEDNCELFYSALDPNPCETSLKVFLEYSLPVNFRYLVQYIENANTNNIQNNFKEFESFNELIEQDEILLKLNILGYLNTTLNGQSAEISSFIEASTTRYFASIVALLCLLVLIILVLIFVVLFNISKTLFNNLKYSYSFLLLIPFHVVKENAYIKLFMKRTMKFKGKFE